MAAHLRSIAYECQFPLCTRTAKVQLYNTRNAPMGVYCTAHGKQELAAHKKRVGETD